MNDLAFDTTDDYFLGGKLLLRQPKHGHRAGHDAILLAAATCAQAGETIIELGAGVGAAGLALATRVPGIALSLVEIDARASALAELNAATNHIATRVLTADVTDFSALEANGLRAGSTDGVMMNPPFHDAARHRPSPDRSRRIAHSAGPETLRTWLDLADRLLKPRGVLTLIWRADGLGEVLAAVSGNFGSLRVQPVHGVRDKPAVRVLLKAVKGGRAPLVIHPAAYLDGSDLVVEAAMRGDGTLAVATKT